MSGKDNAATGLWYPQRSVRISEQEHLVSRLIADGEAQQEFVSLAPGGCTGGQVLERGADALVAQAGCDRQRQRYAVMQYHDTFTAQGIEAADADIRQDAGAGFIFNPDTGSLAQRILGGIAVGALGFAAVRLGYRLDDDLLCQIVRWTVGDVAGVRMDAVLRLALAAGADGAATFALAHRLNLIALGQAASHGL